MALQDKIHHVSNGFDADLGDADHHIIKVVVNFTRFEIYLLLVVLVDICRDTRDMIVTHVGVETKLLPYPGLGPGAQSKCTIRKSGLNFQLASFAELTPIVPDHGPDDFQECMAVLE